MNIVEIDSCPLEHVFSIGQALTSACDMNCPHCYSRKMVKKSATVADCQLVCKAFPNLKEINFGTGETYLNENFLDIFDFYYKQGIKMAMTTNGNTLKFISDDEIKRYISDVDISLDFPNREMHDAWRIDGSFDHSINMIGRLKELGINLSIALALTNKNYIYLPEFLEILKKYKILLRINIYKPVQNYSLVLNYDQFWTAMKLIADNFGIVGISEPILSIFYEAPNGNGKCGSQCGHSLRVHADLSVSGCVFISSDMLKLEDFINFKATVPIFCQNCKYMNRCRGGCLGRRILQGGHDRPDYYCPFFNGKKLPDIKFVSSPDANVNLVHLNYLCTMVLSPNRL